MADIFTFEKLKYYIRADLYRYRKAQGIRQGFATYRTWPGFRFSFWMRTTAYFHCHRIWWPFYCISKSLYHRYLIKYGIQIPFTTAIGPGLFIGHFGCIVVNCEAVIGRNCNLSHGVTIGRANRGERKGCPIIGDEVYFGPGSKVIGQVSIGSNVAIGANSVVTKDVKSNEVVVGIPAHVVSDEGTEGYINYIDYE
jgi:serine O-acetyltransferase